jgi:3-isopropylmalate/(R)-2-methylmalate dehydratase large subunit
VPAHPRAWALADRWRGLASDEDARFDAEVRIDASLVTPMVTWGTNPGMAVGIGDVLPELDDANRSAFEYMGLSPGAKIAGLPVNVVFVGSCTNGRIEDFRAAATVLRGRRVADGVRMLVVPGSYAVTREAERDGLDAVVRAAGAEWREPGCTMCIAMNGEAGPPGAYAASTSNRNFPGRQGPGARTFLCSPATAAATAVAGALTDPRRRGSKETQG